MVNESIDLTGLKVKVNYNDGSNVLVGPASLDYPMSVSSSETTSIELSYQGCKTTLDNLSFKTPQKYYFEAEAYEAYWSMPNNKPSGGFKIHTVDEKVAHGGKYVGGLNNECFGISYMFYANQLTDAIFTLSSDTCTNIDGQTPVTRSLDEMYEFHVNGEKVDLRGNMTNGPAGVFRKVRLASAKLRSGLNTVSLTHIVRNGSNGSIDYIGVTTPADVTLTDYSLQLIEAESMQLSGNDLKNEGNNASKTDRQDFDNVGNRAAGQAGWAMTTIHSPINQKAALFINFGLCAEFNMSNWIISVNDKKVENVDTKIPFHFWPGIDWRDWNEFYICELDLVNGENVIKIEKTLVGAGTNMDYIKIMTVA